MIKLPSPALIGVIHLPALPGSPSAMLGMDEILDRAVADAGAIRDAGFDAIIVENFGDAPFSPDRIPPASVAAMAIAAFEVRRASALPLGINALRNDAAGALGIAAACDASFVRVNVHTGVCATDQGLLEGKAHETLTYRKLLSRKIAILADVDVKHGRSLSESNIAAAARNAAYRGHADGLIVTGTATGEPVDPEDLRRVRDAVPDRRLFVGSGATAETVRSLLSLAGGVIVGTGIKLDCNPSRPIDPELARAFVAAAREGRTP